MNSLWLKDTNKKHYPTLKENIKTDILIIGGGFCGISLAFELSTLNKKIVLVEQNELYQATSGRTTGKITFQHGDIYHYLRKRGKEYLLGNLKAMQHLHHIIEKYQIDCQYCSCDNELLFPSKKAREKEKKAYQTLGIDYEEMGKDNHYGLKVKNQATFHIIQYLDKILTLLEQWKNVNIYEHSKVDCIDKKKKIAFGKKFTIQAEKIIFANMYPNSHSFPLFFLKLKPVLSFVCVGKTKHTMKDCYYSLNDNVFSYRPYLKDYLIFSGKSFKSAKVKSYQELANTFITEIKQYFPEISIEELWVNQDYQTLDKIPLIGQIYPDIYLATGWNKWGISNSVLASMVIKEEIVSSKSTYRIFSPKRHLPPFAYFTNIVENAWHYFTSKIIFPPKKCTHLHCNLRKNSIDNTWDCPCHGSRFLANGKVMIGPAKKNLK